MLPSSEVGDFDEENQEEDELFDNKEVIELIEKAYISILGEK